jgi:hypothetical protein
MRAIAVCVASSIALSATFGQTLSKEYIRLGGRVVAIENYGFGVAPSSQYFLAGGGTGSIAIGAQSSVSWTATTSATWVTITSPTTGSGSQSLQYSVGVNTTATAMTASITITPNVGAAASVTINLAGATSAQPTVTLLNSLTNGSFPLHSTQQTVSFRVDDPNGPGYIYNLWFTINNQDNGADSCYAHYVPQTGVFYFFDSAGNPTQYTLGSTGTVSNYACSLNLAASSVSIGSTSITMNLAVTIQKSSVGTLNVYVDVQDATYAGPNGISSATWTAYDEISATPPTVSAVQAPTSATSQTLYMKLSDTNGYRYIDEGAQWALSADSTINNSPCFLFLYPFAQSATLYTVSGGAYSYVGGGTLGATGVLGSGSPCSINLSGSKFHVNASNPDPNASLITELYLDLAVSLASSSTLPINIYLDDVDRTGRGLGVWNIVANWP